MMKFKIFMKKIVSFIKHYWYIPIIFVAIIIGFIILRRKPNGLAAVLTNSISSRQKEIKSIEEAHEQEIAERDRALKLYHSTIKQLEEKYKSDNQDLTSKKKKEIKKIIEENKSDSVKLSERISEYSGFSIVYPKD